MQPCQRVKQTRKNSGMKLDAAHRLATINRAQGGTFRLKRCWVKVELVIYERAEAPRTHEPWFPLPTTDVKAHEFLALPPSCK